VLTRFGRCAVCALLHGWSPPCSRAVSVSRSAPAFSAGSCAETHHARRHAKTLSIGSRRNESRTQDLTDGQHKRRSPWRRADSRGLEHVQGPPTRPGAVTRTRVANPRYDGLGLLAAHPHTSRTGSTGPRHCSRHTRRLRPGRRPCSSGRRYLPKCRWRKLSHRGSSIASAGGHRNGDVRFLPGIPLRRCPKTPSPAEALRPGLRVCAAVCHPGQPYVGAWGRATDGILEHHRR
jgi:hypothetical protein